MMINIIANQLIVDNHCYDYFDLTEAEIIRAVTKAKEGFITLSDRKSPTVLGSVGFDFYGFVVTKENRIITVLSESDYNWNGGVHCSLKSRASEVLVS